MKQEDAALLRAEFPAETIGKLPKLNCSACAQKKGGPARDRHCENHKVKKCDICGNYLSEAHIHLDYVGHAATTDRLLKVDPDWTWRPMATEVDTGFPKFDNQGGLWILLTVKDVTRPGYGDGANPKEVISDAIRNAAMRFGVALDLWAKEDLHAADSDVSTTRPARQSKPAAVEHQPPAHAPAASAAQDEHTLWIAPDGADMGVIDQKQRRTMFGVAGGRGLNQEAVRQIVLKGTGVASTAGLQQWQFDNVMLEINQHAEVQR